MRPRINLAWPALVAFLCLASCTSFESEYEKGVYDYEPLYCYQTLGGVDCHRKPHHRDATRLVNYYGPAPSKYKPPKPPGRKPAAASAQGERGGVRNPSAEDLGRKRRRGRRRPWGQERTGGGEEKSEWKEWLPLLSVAFGALQVVAAFAFSLVAKTTG